MLAICGDQRSAEGGLTSLDSDHWHGMVEELAAAVRRAPEKSLC